MIETIMYMGIGFLAGCLIGLAVMPLIHDRAARLTMRRLEGSIPQSVAEIQADKDLLRAEFAMSARRLEIIIERHRHKLANQLVQLGQKSDIINRLKLERDDLMIELVRLKSELSALKKRFDVPRREIKPRLHVGSLLRQWVPHRAHH